VAPGRVLPFSVLFIGDLQMLVSIFDKIIDKTPLNSPEGNSGYKNQDLNRIEFAQSIQLGRAFSCQLKGPRKSVNFLAIGFAGLDFDHDLTLEEVLANPFIQQYAFLVYATPSHQKNGNGDRFRVLFELPEPIYEAATYKSLILGLLKKFPQADPSAKDAARIWYGSSQGQQFPFTGILDSKTVSELIDQGKQVEIKKSAIQKERSDNFPLEEVEKMLTFINSEPGHYVWLQICLGLGNAFGEDAIPIIEAWSPDDQGGRYIRQIIQRADGRVSLGTVIYHAMQNGYKLSHEFVKKKRTAEQVVYQDVFNSGFEYATIGASLYAYQEGYYKELSDQMVKKKIAEYLNIYPTGQNENKFATDAKILSALNFVKKLCQVPGELINPAGINLKNGFFQPVYSADKQVQFKLLPHTSERYCTYRTDFDYIPNADSTEFQRIIDSMLPADYQEILFRLLGASIDLQEVRKRKGRAVRLLMLYGVGSNGKDTIKEWVSLLYGGHGLTNVPLQAFRKADKDRSFDLMPLVHSRLNWSSENAAISIDTCQTLKNFVTGDEINVEEKNVQGFTIKPKAIGIFNLNELPHIETMQESISSRYAIIEFPYVFTMNPQKENERPVDPRIKGDPVFIHQNILPALLNRIIQGFHDIMAKGVDYKSTNTLMLKVRQENSHLLQFIEEEGMIEAPYTEGITARTIFTRYTSWCIKVGLIDIPITRRNDPSPYDKVITSETQIVRRFRKFFPSLESKAHGIKGRVLNVKFVQPELNTQTLNPY
jgi:phage/plasmid-associated DNA primase